MRGRRGEGVSARAAGARASGGGRQTSPRNEGWQRGDVAAGLTFTICDVASLSISGPASSASSSSSSSLSSSLRMRRISAVSLSPPLCEALPPPRRRDSRRAARSLRSFSCRAVIASEPDAVCSRAATPRRAGHSGRAAAISGFSHAASARGAEARRERTGAAAGSARARAQAQGRRPTARHRARLTSPHARYGARVAHAPASVRRLHAMKNASRDIGARPTPALASAAVGVRQRVMRRPSDA